MRRGRDVRAPHRRRTVPGPAARTTTRGPASAAGRQRRRRLHALVEDFDLDVVTAYMGHVRDNAAEAVHRVISALRDGTCRYELDSGANISVSIAVDHDTRSAHI